LHFKDSAGSLRSDGGRTLRSDLTAEICLPLQRSEILLLKRFFSNFRSFASFAAFVHSLPSIIYLSGLILCLPIDYKLVVLMSSSLLPSMTSIHCLLNICQQSMYILSVLMPFVCTFFLYLCHSLFLYLCHSLSVKYLPTISPFGIDGNTSTHMHSNLLSCFFFLPL
jgi:hypothetical protein